MTKKNIMFYLGLLFVTLDIIFIFTDPFGDATIPISVTFGIVGIVLIAQSRKK